MPAQERVRAFSRRRSLLFGFILVAGFFAATELVLRMVGVRRLVRPRILLRAVDVDIDFPFMRPDAEVFWAPKPGWRGEFQGKAVTINSLGLRGAEPARPNRAGWRRLAVFGDSITFGYGVADEETYAAQAGRLLAGERVDVVNAGVTGYTSHQVLRLLKRVAPALRPDVATFCIGWNDGNVRAVDDRAFARHLRAAQRIEVLTEHLYLYRAMKALYLRSTMPDAPPSARTRRVSVDDYRENLRGMVRECRERGIRPVFLELPRRRHRGEALPRWPYADTLAAVAAELDVPLLPTGELGLGTRAPENGRYFIDALHFTPGGHELMARMLIQGLREQSLLEPADAVLTVRERAR
jgi:lysophospholipase L1-like esterase